jgi:glycosyltransferase involved in cell wall biosynthesis
MGGSLKKLIWSSLDDYLPPGIGFHQVGRNIANHNFFQALLKYGHFDEYHLFLANSAHRRRFEEGHDRFLESIDATHKVKLFDRFELPVQIRKHDYAVFHQSDHVTFFNSLCHIRNQIGAFPITAFIHSLSYQHFMSKYLEMALGGVTSEDSLICSSMSGKKVLENCFQRIREQLNGKGPPVQMEVIPLAIDGERFPEIDQVVCRKQLGLDEKEAIGLCFGRFSDYDKMDLFPLIQAFQRICAENRSWRLILAGALHSESYFKILQLWTAALGIADRVTFIVNLSEKDKAALYKSADFFISLSDNPQETFGLTLLEAMACELPLLVSEFDGYQEIVTDEVGKRIKTTWSDFDSLTMVAPLMDEVTFHRYLAQSICIDVEELSRTLRFFFSNPGQCREMGKAARDRFLRLYDYRVVIPRLERLWSRLKENFCFTPPNPQPDPLAMDVFRCFSHYVTQMLTPEMRVRLTDFGRNLLVSKAEYPFLPEMEPLIDRTELKTVMEQAQTPRSVRDILKADGPGVWEKRYLILWMLKHGILGSYGPNPQDQREKGNSMPIHKHL